MSIPNAIAAYRRTGLAVAVLAGTVLGGHWCREYLAVDSCLDAGHAYDYIQGRCDTLATTLPVIPYTDRHGVFLRVAAGLMLSGIALALASRGFVGPPDLTFSSGMALLIMGLAVWAVPGWSRLVLVAPVIAGTGWALVRLRRSR